MEGLFAISNAPKSGSIHGDHALSQKETSEQGRFSRAQKTMNTQEGYLLPNPLLQKMEDVTIRRISKGLLV